MSSTGFSTWTHSVHHVHPTPGLCYPAVRYHFFAVSQLHHSAAPSEFSSLVRDMTSNIEERGVWMKGNKLKMNDDKTELITIELKSKLKWVNIRFSFFCLLLVYS